MLSEVIYFSGLFCLSFQASEHEETNVPLELDALVPISLPFTSVIDVELKDGAELLLKGFAKDRFERMYVALWGKELTNMSVIPLHLYANFEEKKVILRAYEGGKWRTLGEESIHYEPHETFDIHINVVQTNVKILVDGHILIEIPNYLGSLRSARFFTVGGGITLSQVYWKRDRPENFPQEFSSRSFPIGRRVMICGIPYGDGFTFDFVSTNDKDIVFHFRGRLLDHKVIRNSRRDGKWGHVDDTGSDPFKQNIPTFIVFLRSPDSINVFVDGNLAFTYAIQLSKDEDIAGVQRWGNFDILGYETTVLGSFDTSLMRNSPMFS